MKKEAILALIILSIFIGLIGCGEKTQTVEKISEPDPGVLEPLESVAMGHSYYNIRFNQDITLVEGKNLAEQIFLRLGEGEEISPATAVIENSVIKIALPPLADKQDLRIRIAKGLIGGKSGQLNEEIEFTLTVLRDAVAPLLSSNQDKLYNITEEYRIRFTEEVWLASEALDTGVLVSIDGQDPVPISKAYVDSDYRLFLTIALPQLVYASSVSIVIPSGLVEDEAKNKNARIEISNIQVVDGQPPKVVLEELYEPLETAGKYILPFDKDLFFIESEDAARSNIVLHNNNKVYGTTPERVRLEEGSKLILEGLDFLGAERFSVEIGANIVRDGLDNQNVAINLPEIQVRADREPPVLSAEQDSIVHLSEEYEIQFNERVVLAAETSAGGGGGGRSLVDIVIGGGTPIHPERVYAAADDRIGLVFLPQQASVGEEARISIGAGFVEDLAGNLNEALALPALTIVADTEGPKLGENEKIIGDSESSYHIYFNERIKLINDAPITAAAITVSIDQGEAVAVGSAVIGSDEKSIEVTLPELRAGEATLRIEGSLVEDYSGNSNSEQILTPITVEDRTPPQLAAEQEDLLQWSKFYKLSFDDVVVAAGGLAAKIRAGRGSAAEEGISSAVLLEDERTLLIEFATRIEEALGENVVIRILAGAVGDQAGNQNEELSHSLTVKADSEGPVFERVEEIREEDSHGRLWFNEPLEAGTPPLEATVTVDGQSTQQAITIATDPSMIEVALPAISIGQELSIVIEAGLLQDLSGNGNDAVNVPAQQALPENTAPEVKSSGGEIEDSAKLYQIEFSEAITAVEGSELAEGIRISVDGRSGLVTATASIRGETSIEIALPELSVGEELVISIEEGIVQDKRSNVNAAATLNPITVVDTTAPRLLEEQDEIVESAQYVIRFHEELRIDDATTIAAKIKVSTNGGAAAGVKSAVLREDSKSLLIELSSMPQVGESLVISIEAGAVSDQHGNANEALTLPAKTAQADSTPPAPLSEQDAIYEDAKDYHIRFDEQLRMASDEAALAAGITLTANGSPAVLGGAYIDSTEKNIVIKMPALTLGEEIGIRIGAGIVADRKGNENGAAELSSKTVLEDITPPELDEVQDALKDVDQEYRVRLNEAVTLAGSEQDLADLITVSIDGEDFSVSGAALEGETVLLVELPAIAAEQTVVIRIAANAVKDKRENANLDLRTAQLIVKDTTPPRMLEVQEQFTYNFNGRVEFNEDIFLVEGKTIDDFKRETYVQQRFEPGAFYGDSMDIEGNSIVFRETGGRFRRTTVQGSGYAYLIFPGGMLQDRAGNVIEESITSPYYFSGYSKPELGTIVSDEIYELDSYIEWESASGKGITMLADTNYDLVQNIKISIDGGLPFSPMYATAVGSLKIYLPPVFAGQSIEITLRAGQINEAFDYSSFLLDTSIAANEEIRKTYQVKNHETYQIRTLAGFYLGDHKEFSTRAFNITTPGFFFDHPIGTIAAFHHPIGIDIDSEGNIYVADKFNHRIRKISTDASVRTVFGSPKGSSQIPGSGYYDGDASVASLNVPTKLHVSDDGNLYVYDTKNRALRKLNIAQNVTSTFFKLAEKSWGPPENGGVIVDSQGRILLAAQGTQTLQNSDLPYANLHSIQADGSSTGIGTASLTDIEMHNGKIYATRKEHSDLAIYTLVEVMVGQGRYSENVLVSGFTAPVALAVADDGETFYVADGTAVKLKTSLNGVTYEYLDDTLYIYRIDYDPATGSSTKTKLPTSFETTGTLLTETQLLDFYNQNEYFLDDYSYMPVKTYTLSTFECFGLELDAENNLIVSNAYHGLILKIFNPDM